MERVLPKTLDYTDVLPLAVESRARRRTFFPVNGATFNSAGANIIRIDLSADALLDTQHSYLRFTFNNPDAVQTCGIGSSGGHAFIRRLRIEQSGTVLEDINSYNRLMGAIVLPCQSTNEHHGERSITEGVKAQGGATGAGSTAYEAQAGYVGGALTADTVVGNNNANTQIGAGGSYDISIPINSGLMNNAKLLPLMLMSAPLTLEIELAPTLEPVCWTAAPAVGYTWTNVRYIANLIEVGGDVSQQLRMVQEVSGGVLTLAGQTYRHFVGNVNTGAGGDQIINVPARVKSMKSLFFASQSIAPITADAYDVEYGGNLGLVEYQLKIGSVVYPPTPVRCNFGAGAPGNVFNRRSEALMELSKAWGSVGSTKGMGQLNNMTWNATPGGNNGGATGKANSTQSYRYGCFGMDLEAFQRVAIESGVNTADRSLPISLILNTDGGMVNGAQTNVDCFVLADALFYLNADGSMSVSV